MAIKRNRVETGKFNPQPRLPYNLRTKDFESAMQDVYDFFFDVNSHLAGNDLERLDEMLRPAIMSGVISDMLTASLSKHSRSLIENRHFNGHPDLVVKGVYPGNKAKAGDQGIEIKTTRKAGGAVDTHGARNQWMCVFVYSVDNETEPARSRRPMTFTEAYLGEVTIDDFRRNARGELGTRTATLHKEGIKKLRQNWLYRL
ncbi:MAG: hypothetical protein HYZ75_17410 [Elusimicrobia bacterium]|nr:hypothetical protein [Elusimicrobiota bacterium]